ncbi:hypothetical protein Tco_0539771 [Tanacetum coccineum]
MGFAISVVFGQGMLYQDRIMDLRFENNGKQVPKPQTTSDEDEFENRNLWFGYVPLCLLDKMHDDDTDDFESEDRSHIIEGNLVISVSCYDGPKPIRCGAQIVYKEEVESTQEIKPPTYYWNWKLSRFSQTTFRCV